MSSWFLTGIDTCRIPHVSGQLGCHVIHFTSCSFVISTTPWAVNMVTVGAGS